ncbi:hypothetical protein J6590_064382 [Homalodisca vitripennis]|nr:hypothetical protein J6590_064382 [Homalodisca vitripennis]
MNFKHPGRSQYGGSIPSWLSQPGPVLLRNQNMSSKYELLGEEVQLIQAPRWTDKTVSIKDLTPAPEAVITAKQDQCKFKDEVLDVGETSSPYQDLHKFHMNYQITRAKNFNDPTKILDQQ